MDGPALAGRFDTLDRLADSANVPPYNVAARAMLRRRALVDTAGHGESRNGGYSSVTSRSA